MAKTDEHLTSAQLAERFNVHKDTPKSWRHKGRGPTWIKVGGAVRYPLKAVEAYENSRSGAR